MILKSYFSLVIVFIFSSVRLHAQFCITPPVPQVSWSCSTASIFWAPLPNAVLYEYRIDSSGIATTQGNTASTNVIINNLSPSTIYVAWLRAICGAGDTSAWAPFTFVTPACGVCPMPVWISALAVGCDSLVFSWDSVASATGFEYAVTLAASTPNTGWISTNTEYANIGGLQDDTVYHLYVRAMCGPGNYSTVQSASIFIPPCLVPNSVDNTTHPIIGALYPNPASNIINLRLNYLSQHMMIKIFDPAGKVMRCIYPQRETMMINIEDLSAGTYILECRDAEKRSFQLFTKL